MRCLVAVLLVLNTAFAQAQELGQLQPLTALFYWQKPLDAIEKKDSASAFGFRFDRAPVTNSVVYRKPLLDLRFNLSGYQSFSIRGSVLHQNQPASGGPAPEPNWWVVGGIVVGSAIVIHQDNKRHKNDFVSKKGGS